MKRKRFLTVNGGGDTAAGPRARKVGGIWVDPMSFPALTDYDVNNL